MSVEPSLQTEQALSALAEQFTHWRQTRSRPHESIPTALWDQAITLSQVLSISRVAKRLGLSVTFGITWCIFFRIIWRIFFP